VTPCGHKPLSNIIASLLAARHRKRAFYALTRCVGFRICPMAKYPGPAGRLVPTSLRSTCRTARDATPVAWGLPDQPGSKRASRRAPMALRSARLAAADYRNGRRRCPQAPSVAFRNRLHIDHSLEPPEIVYSGGDSPRTAALIHKNGPDRRRTCLTCSTTRCS